MQVARELHIEEIRGGAGRISGVSTSEAAFIDYLGRGPMNQAVRVASYVEFENIFGGLHTWSESSYAVRQFFLNGGQAAWIVRVPVGNPETAAVSLRGLSGDQDTLLVLAANAGRWGNKLQIAVTPEGSSSEPTAFNLFVRDVDVSGGEPEVRGSETFTGLSMNPASLHYAVRIVNESSRLIRLGDEGNGEIPCGAAASENGEPFPDAWRSLQNGNDGNPRDDLGNPLDVSAFAGALLGSQVALSGMYALDALALFRVNLMCFPSAPDLGAHAASVYSEAIVYCVAADVFLIVDIPKFATSTGDIIGWIAENDGLRSENAAVYFPRTLVSDPLGNGELRNIACSGTILGVYARTDAARGVWAAPSGSDAVLLGVTLVMQLTDGENGTLSSLGINTLRNFLNFGPVSWGSRTLAGADRPASEWKYVAGRRMALFLERSLDEGSNWIMFEPNGEPLWSQIRFSFGRFLYNLFRQGAFQATTPADAYFIKCDCETTTPADIDSGIVNILVGFAALKPAEFIVIRMQRIAGQVAA